MKSLKPFKIVFLFFSLIIISSCGDITEVNFNRGKDFYYKNNIDEAIENFTKVLSDNPNNVDALNWLAQSYLRKGENKKAKKYSRKSLDIDNENAFAHLILGKSLLPHYTETDTTKSDSSWSHYMLSIEYDSTNPNIWIEIWGESIRRQNYNYWKTSVKKLYETDFLTSAALEYGRWMLRTLPQNSILLTYGDMDTYPPQALQEVENFRKDVTIVEIGLLNLKWSLKFLRDYCNVPLPFTNPEIDDLSPVYENDEKAVSVADQLFFNWIKEIKSGEFKRPLIIAPSVAEEFYSKYKDYISFSGSHFIVNSKKVDNFLNMAKIEESLNGLTNSDFSGPWASDKDLSPIRTIYTKRIVKNISYSVMIYVKELIKNGETEKALRRLIWLEEFEKNTEIGPSFNKEIAELKRLCKKH